MSRFLLLYSDVGSAETIPVDPGSLSPNNHLDETGARSPTNWTCDVTGDSFGDGGATSYYPFTQNSLAYYQTDAGFTPFFRNDSTNWFTSNATNFSFVIVHKTTAAGSTEQQRIFWQTSDDAQAFWEVRKWTDLYPYYRAIDDSANQMFVNDTYPLNDNTWYITIMTVDQTASAGELTVYQSTGNKLSTTSASWVPSNYNGGLSGTFLNGGGGANSSWCGVAEIAFYNDKILTLGEANSIGAWLADKWDITWVDNT